MSTKVEKRILVNVPVSVAYNQWTQFEEFPHFMGGVKSVKQLSDDRLEWVAEMAGVRRQWQARILEQVPDRKVAWAATEGATNAGSVSFEDLGGGQTSIQLSLEYEPEGLVEKVGDKLNIVDKQAEGDLNRFKTFIEDEGYATGAWRGTVNEGAAAGSPGVEAAAGPSVTAGKPAFRARSPPGSGSLPRQRPELRQQPAAKTPRVTLCRDAATTRTSHGDRGQRLPGRGTRRESGPFRERGCWPVRRPPVRPDQWPRRHRGGFRRNGLERHPERG